MDVEYSTREASISSNILDYSKSKSNRSLNVLSPEDIAWADSCLINHPECLNGDWNSLRYALETSLVSSSDQDNMDIVPSIGETNPKEFIDDPGTLDYGFVAENEPDMFLSQILESNRSENKMRDSSWPNHNDTIKIETMSEADVLPSSEAKVSFSRTSSMQDAILQKGTLRFSASEIEWSNQEMDTPIEEDGRDGYIERLKKALAVISVDSLPSTLGDSVTMRDASLDDLVAQIRYLSMERPL